MAASVMYVHSADKVLKVYSKARDVLVWLGKEHGNTTNALRSIDILLDQCSAETDNFRDLEDMILRRMDDKSYNIYSDAPLPSSCDWDALGRSSSQYLFRSSVLISIPIVD